MPRREPRILLFDIETAPCLGYTWSKWEQNVIAFEQEWYILSIAWRWLGEKTVHVKGLIDYPRFKKEPENDIELVKLSWSLLDEADLIIGHNSVAFDTKKIQSRMIVHGFDPPSSFKEVDTLQLARKHFSFLSNRLNDVCESLGIGSKLDTHGFGTWLGCIKGDEESWRRMLRYNKQDVVLLTALYERLRPWAKSHPNLSTISGRPDSCPKCGSEEGFESKGYAYTNVGRKRRRRCKSCGGSVTDRKIERTETRYVS